MLQGLLSICIILICSLWLSVNASIAPSEEIRNLESNSMSIIDDLVESVDLCPEFLISLNESFVLPDYPNPSLIMNYMHLLDTLNTSFDLVISAGKRLRNHDETSKRLFSSSITCLAKLSFLLNAAKAAPGKNEYFNLIVSITGLAEKSCRLLRLFMASLIQEDLYQMKNFDKNVILNFANLRGLFFVIKAVLSQEDMSFIIELIFSAVDSVESETLVWTFFKRYNSKADALPLPHKFFFRNRSKVIKETLVADLIKALNCDIEDAPLSHIWFHELGVLFRLKTISLSDFLEILQELCNQFFEAAPLIISPEHEMSIVYFIRFVCFNEQALPDRDPIHIHFHNDIVTHYESAELEDFFTKIWEILFAPLLKIQSSIPEGSLKMAANSAVKYLEIKFPGISKKLECFVIESFPEMESFEVLVNLSKLVGFDVASASIPEINHFVRYDLLKDIKNIPLTEKRFFITTAQSKIDEIANHILNTEISENDLTSLVVDLMDQTDLLVSHLKFLEPRKSEDKIITLVDFVFKLNDLEIAQNIMKYVSRLVLETFESQQIFFTRIAANLKARPDFFCLKADAIDMEFFFYEFVISNFVDQILDLPLTAPLLHFISTAFNQHYISADQVNVILDAFGTRFPGIEVFNDRRCSEFIVSVCRANGSEENDLQVASQNTIRFLRAISSLPLTVFKSIYGSPNLFTAYSYVYLYPEIKPVLLPKDSPNSLKSLHAVELSSIEPDSFLKHFIDISYFAVKKGLTQRDLKAIHDYLLYVYEHCFVQMMDLPHRFIVLNGLVLTSILLIRSDDSLISVDFAKKLMNSIRSQSNGYSFAQVFFKSFSSKAKKAQLLEELFRIGFSPHETNFRLDEHVFDSVNENRRFQIMEQVLKDMQLSHGMDRRRGDHFCFWVNQALVPIKLVDQFINILGQSPKDSVKIRVNSSIMRSVFENEKYKSLRMKAARILCFRIDHSAVFPKPFGMGIIGSALKILPEPDFMNAIDRADPLAYDFRDIANGEGIRLHRLTEQTSFNISDGIENVTGSYLSAIVMLNNFDLALDHKINLIKSILRNLQRLTVAAGTDELIATASFGIFGSAAFTAEIVEDFVRVALELAFVIQSDLAGPPYSFLLNDKGVEIYLKSITKYVTDTRLQTHYIHSLLHTLANNPSNSHFIFTVLPKYNSRVRFLIHPETISTVFNLAASPERFDAFMFDLIDSAFVEQELDDAWDLSRQERSNEFISDRFYVLMIILIKDYFLPAKYILKAIKKMTENAKYIDVEHAALSSFLRVALMKRDFSDPSKAPTLNVVKRSYGPDCVFDDRQNITLAILEFLNNRPEFLVMAFSVFLNNKSPINDSFSLIGDLFAITGNEDYNLYSSALHLPNTKLVYVIYTWAIMNSIKLRELLETDYKSAQRAHINRVKDILPSTQDIPDHCIRSFVHWIQAQASIFPNSASDFILLILSLVPKKFSLHRYMDFKESKSWYSITPSIINEFDRFIQKPPQGFIDQIDEDILESYLNLLMWTLEYDDKEENFSKRFLNLSSVVSNTSEHVRHHFLRLLASEYYGPIFVNIRKSAKLFSRVVGHLRCCVGKNENLVTDLQNIFHAIYRNISHVKFDTNENGDDVDTLKYSEDDVMLKRSQMLNYFAILDKFNPSFDFDRQVFIELCFLISDLRIMQEFDLPLLFVSKLAKIARKFMQHEPIEALQLLAVCIAVGIRLNYFCDEILFHTDSAIPADLLNFLLRFIPFDRKADCVDGVNILINHFTATAQIEHILSDITKSLQLDVCLFSLILLPQQFLDEREICERFAFAYFNRLFELGTLVEKNGNVTIDGAHFLFLFSLLHRINASRELFAHWTKCVYGIQQNDLVSERFSEDLRAHCIQRKSMLYMLPPVLINASLVKTLLNRIANDTSVTDTTAKNLVDAFKLIYSAHPDAFNGQITKSLPSELQGPFRQIIIGQIDVKKRQIIEGIVKACPFDSPNHENLTKSLETIFKLDLSVLLPETQEAFFSALNARMHHLSVAIEADPERYQLNLIALAAAIRSKHGRGCELYTLSVLLRACEYVQISAEPYAQLLLAFLDIQNSVTFNREDIFAFVAGAYKLPPSQKYENPSAIINMLLHHSSITPRLQAEIAKTILLKRKTSNNFTIDDVSLVKICIQLLLKSRNELFIEVFNLAKEQKIFGKTELSILNLSS